MPAFVGFWFPLCRSDTISHLGVSFAWYGLYKNEKCICPYLRLTAETETQFLRNCSQFQAACMKKFLVCLR